MLHRIIPSSGELLPAIGFGTWQTFDVDDNAIYPQLKQVLQQLHESGGRVIDSSPMYGKSEEVVGDITAVMDVRNEFFYATKVWTTGLHEGIKQLENSFQRMRRDTIDLVQVHNLTDWETHLPQLRYLKEQGKIRYIGITHYTDESHEEIEKIMRQEPLDFVQFNYSISGRHAEERLLGTAEELGIATLINRPLGQGNLIKKVIGKMLPPWAEELGIVTWAAFFLKYILAHPAVTCVIPATHNPSHATELLAAGAGDLPDTATKAKMLAYLQSL